MSLPFILKYDWTFFLKMSKIPLKNRRFKFEKKINNLSGSNHFLRYN